jgi:hypothetical protein
LDFLQLVSFLQFQTHSFENHFDSILCHSCFFRCEE